MHNLWLFALRFFVRVMTIYSPHVIQIQLLFNLFLSYRYSYSLLSTCHRDTVTTFNLPLSYRYSHSLLPPCHTDTVTLYFTPVIQIRYYLLSPCIQIQLHFTLHRSYRYSDSLLYPCHWHKVTLFSPPRYSNPLLSTCHTVKKWVFTLHLSYSCSH